MVLRSNGEISSSSVFMRHFWSRVRKACTTSPLLSVIMVLYSILSGSGNTQLSVKKIMTAAVMVINRRMPYLNVFLFVGVLRLQVFTRFNQVFILSRHCAIVRIFCLLYFNNKL